MAGPVDVCDIHVEQSLLGKDLIEAMTKEEFANVKKKKGKLSGAALQDERTLMKFQIANLIDDGLSKRVKEINDVIKLQEMKEKVLVDKVTGKPITNMSDAITNRLRMTVGRNSVDTRARNLRNHYRNMLWHFEGQFRTNENVNAPKSLSEIEKGSAVEEDLFIRVRQYEEEIDPTTLTPERINSLLEGKTEMDRLALSIVAYNSYVRRTLADFGISTRYSKDYVVHRRYDYAAIKDKFNDNPEAFADYLYERLDIEKTFGGELSEEAAKLRLRNVFADIKKQVNEKLDPTSVKEFRGGRPEAFATKFVWKNDKAAYESFRDLSVGGLREQIEQGASGTANRAIAISEFGYDAHKNLAELTAHLHNTFKQEIGLTDQWKLNQIKRAEKELSGQMHLVSGSLTNFHNNVRFFQAFTKLGNAVTGTILDAVDNGRQGFYMNGSFFGGVHDYVQEFVKSAMPKMIGGRSEAEMIEIANHINLIFSHMSNAEGMRLASGDIATKSGAITSWVQTNGSKWLNRATLLPLQTSYSNIASGLSGARQFSKLIGAAKEGKLNKFQKDFLNEYGFTKEEVKALSEGFFESTPNWSDRDIFTGTGIRNALVSKKPEEVAQVLGVNPLFAGDAVMKLATKIESVINDYASRGTPKPELATKTIMGKNIDSEGARVAIGFMTQFLDTPIAQGQYALELAQKLHRINDGDWGAIMKDGALPSALFITSGLGLYMAADSFMAAVTNRPSLIQRYNNGDSDERRSILLDAIGRTGYVPFVFEMIDNTTGGGYNRTALDTFGSPALGTLRDTLLFAQGQKKGSDFLRRQLPSNAIIPRAVNNWTGTFMGEKIWDDKQGTFWGDF